MMGVLNVLSSTAPDRSPSRMQTMPGKSLATSLIACSYCLLCHRIMGGEHDWESSECLARHSRLNRPGDSWPLPAAVCLVLLTRPGIDGGSGRISGRRVG